MSQNKSIEAEVPDPEVIPQAKRRRLKAFAEAMLPEKPGAGKTVRRGVCGGGWVTGRPTAMVRLRKNDTTFEDIRISIWR